MFKGDTFFSSPPNKYLYYFPAKHTKQPEMHQQSCWMHFLPHKSLVEAVLCS